MIKHIEIAGHHIDLITSDVNWASPVSIKARIADRIETGLTAIESRTASHGELRHEISASWALAGAELQSWEKWLGNEEPPGTGQVGLPLPVDVMLASQWTTARRIYEAAHVCVLSPVSDPDIVPATLVTPEWIAALVQTSPLALLAPLFVGKLKQRPRFAPVSGASATVSITLVEDSPWLFRLAPVAPAQALPPDWPEALEANWRKAPEDATIDSISYSNIGATRVRAVEGMEGRVRRTQKFQLSLENREQVRLLLSFFLGRRGRVESFGAPWVLRPGEASAQTPHVTRARFAEDSLSLGFPHADAAEARVAFQQVPAETEPPAGEQPARPSEAFLYRFSIINPDGTTAAIWRYTDWGHDLVVQENDLPVTYTGDASGLIQHDTIEQDSELGDNSTTLTMSANIPGNPLLPLAARAIDLPVQIDILSCDPAAPAADTLLYSGTVATVEADGRKLSAKTSVLGGLLEIKVPSLYYSPTCNWRFCGPGCGKQSAAYSTTLQLRTQAGSTVTATITRDAPGAPAPAMAEYFARGYIIVRGAPAQIRQITGSTARAGNAISITLKTPLSGFSQGMIATIRPDCDGSVSICRTRYDNLENFGGHPRMGPKNLSLPSVTSDGGSKGK